MGTDGHSPGAGDDVAMDVLVLIMRTFVVVAAGLLIAGSALPFARDHSGTYRILNAPHMAFVEGGDSASVVLAIGFGGLIACIFLAVGCMWAQALRSVGRVAERGAKILVVLLAIGGIVPLVASVGSANNQGSGGPAMALFIPGVLVFAVCAYNPTLARAWRLPATTSDCSMDHE